jgi:LmbE family N-acetylglucosaminyl deacetylase
MKTLIIAPHMDDEAISCGGLIQTRVAAGGEVRVLALFGRNYTYSLATPAEQKASDFEEYADFQRSCGVLGVKGWSCAFLEEGEPAKVGYYRVLHMIEDALKEHQPDEVIGPSVEDLNQDHRFISHAVGIALRPFNLGSVKRVYDFIALDSTVQQPSHYVTLSPEQVLTKIGAVNAYRREAREGFSPRSPELMQAQMRVWGSRCNTAYAEGYRLRFSRE